MPFLGGEQYTRLHVLIVESLIFASVRVSPWFRFRLDSHRLHVHWLSGPHLAPQFPCIGLLVQALPSVPWCSVDELGLGEIHVSWLTTITFNLVNFSSSGGNISYDIKTRKDKFRPTHCWNSWVISLHYESKKTRHLTLVHNFTKYWPIFKILSLLDSVGNLYQSHVQIPHHILNVSLHYLVKYLCSKNRHS